MSRKPSKTSTTVRRENLLRTVTELRPGRMTTNGLFRLGSQTLTEVGRQSGRVQKNNYFVVRNNLRDALRLAATSPNAENLIPTYYNGSTGVTRYRVRVGLDTISIGCKVFTGKAAAALRDWALTE